LDGRIAADEQAREWQTRHFDTLCKNYIAMSDAQPHTSHQQHDARLTASAAQPESDRNLDRAQL
jgi:hypothetical protein